MSHGKISNTFPSQIVNKLQGIGTGRTTLNLDQQLLTRCPMYTSTLQQNIECATTKDWNLQGNVAVFGPSDLNTLQTFRAAVLSRPFSTPLAAQRKAHASIFWIWPVFLWPNAGPIGLVDRTVISLAWSIAP